LSLLQRRIRTGWEAMISPLRSLHRRTFVALAIVLPVILSIGIGARSRPGSNSGGSSLPATWYVVKQSSSLWQKNTILSTFYSTPSRPQDIHVVLVPSHELNEPDLLLYWANDPPSGNALPTEAQFIGAFSAGHAFLLPLNEKRAGHLMLFSSAYQTVFDTANLETLP
jgi:hypothetical protein